MQQGSGFEIPLRIIGPNGTTVLWQGSGWLGTVLVGKAATAVSMAAEVNLVAASFIIQADNLAASTEPRANVLSVQNAPTTPAMLVGVAMNAAAANESVVIAGTGSIVGVLTSAVTHTVGQHAVAAAAGALAASATTTPVAPANSLGFAVKNRGTTGGATDTGTDTRAGYLVNIHAGST